MQEATPWMAIVNKIPMSEEDKYELTLFVMMLLQRQEIVGGYSYALTPGQIHKWAGCVTKSTALLIMLAGLGWIEIQVGSEFIEFTEAFDHLFFDGRPRYGRQRGSESPDVKDTLYGLTFEHYHL